MPQLNVRDENLKALPNGKRFLLNLRQKSTHIELKYLKPRNHKRPTIYTGRRQRNSVVLTVANGRGQRRT